MKNSWLFVLVAALVLVAGCSAPSGPAPAPGAGAPGAGAPGAGEPGAGGMVDGSISFVDVPAEVLIGKAIEVKWHVGGSGTTSHTAVHYSTKSKASIAEPTTQDYQGFQPKDANAGASLPGDFSAVIQFDEPITIYVRAHAVVNGENVWTEEKSVKIVTKMASTGMVADESADDEMAAE